MLSIGCIPEIRAQLLDGGSRTGFRFRAQGGGKPGGGRQPNGQLDQRARHWLAADEDIEDVQGLLEGAHRGHPRQPRQQAAHCSAHPVPVGYKDQGLGPLAAARRGTGLRAADGADGTSGMLTLRTKGGRSIGFRVLG